MHLIIGIVGIIGIIFLGLATLYPLIDKVPEPTEAKTPEGFFWLNCLQALAYAVWLFVPVSLAMVFVLWY